MHLQDGDRELQNDRKGRLVQLFNIVSMFPILGKYAVSDHFTKVFLLDKILNKPCH